MTQAEWIREIYPGIISRPEYYQLQECELHPGEILYFPDKWMHATLNTDNYNVFASVFIDKQLLNK